MLFLLVGVALLLLKLGDIAPVAAWSWVWVLSPFGLAAAWWAWADWSGYTKRKAMNKEDARKQARLDRQREKMGINARKKR